MNNTTPDPLSVVTSVQKLVPVIGATVVAVSAFFNLQSQVSDLRTRVDLQTTTTTGVLTDIKTDIKDLKSQLNAVQNLQLKQGR
ncbi:hypothetical protein LPP2_g38 [Leptolyngbya phage LPP-2, strain SPI]|uniref:Uncharacterized protein n=1 Tax=Leptolyngbya phage LPP-2, strain SPI TaxID=2996053 RepID=A0AAE9PQU5_9CAUD|nr:hypothetical protein LPP2_g38 [Leptolyngbya phage LPP-2 st. SPI]